MNNYIEVFCYVYLYLVYFSSFFRYIVNYNINIINTILPTMYAWISSINNYNRIKYL